MKKLLLAMSILILCVASCASQATNFQCEKMDGNNDIYIDGEKYHVEVGYGPRANEIDGKLPDPDKKSIDGLGVYREGEFFLLKWSVPVKNDISPMQAVATAQVVVGCAYPSGATNTYKDSGEVEVEPGQSRLINGVIKVPVSDVAGSARGVTDLSGLFPYFQTSTQMNGIAFKGQGLNFDYMGKKDGFATARWQATCNRRVHNIVATAKGAKPATLDTADMKGTATCRVYDKDGKLLKEDCVNLDKSSGTITATGFIRLPEEQWKTVDWRKAEVTWLFQ